MADFMFQNVANRATVYRTGVLVFTIENVQNKALIHKLCSYRGSRWWAVVWLKTFYIYLQCEIPSVATL